MTKESFLLLRSTMTTKRFMMGDRKSEAYTKGSNDRLANFRTNAIKNRTTDLSVWNIYAGKHWDAIQSYIMDGVEGPEGIESNIQDVQNYCDLLIAMVFDKKSIDNTM